MKSLVVIPENCTGCRRCMLWCSFRKTGFLSLVHSRIYITELRSGYGFDIPVVCIHCGLCMHACPLNIIKREKTGAIVVDEEKCVGCGLCVQSCPYGAITVDPITKRALKCDLCNGDPECVKHCPGGALSYLDVDKAVKVKRAIYANMLKSR